MHVCHLDMAMLLRECFHLRRIRRDISLSLLTYRRDTMSENASWMYQVVCSLYPSHWIDCASWIRHNPPRKDRGLYHPCWTGCSLRRWCPVQLAPSHLHPRRICYPLRQGVLQGLCCHWLLPPDPWSLLSKFGWTISPHRYRSCHVSSEVRYPLNCTRCAIYAYHPSSVYVVQQAWPK